MSQLKHMQGIQKMKCTSCGVTFMSENGASTCPSCASNSSLGHGHDDSSGCGCGHSH
jgi:rubrerythrin